MNFLKCLSNIGFLLLFLLSSKVSFAALAKPSIAYPYDNSVVNNRFDMTVSAVGNAKSVYQVDIVPTFNSSSLYRSSPIAGDYLPVDSLAFHQVYYFRIKIFNATMTDSSSWSNSFTYTTINNPTLSKSEGMAVVYFTWNKVYYTTLEIQIDTSNQFNSKRFLTAVSANENHTFYYTKSNEMYYYRYRYRYGSKYANWSTISTIQSKAGFQLSNNHVFDSFNLKRKITLITNYNSDTNVTYMVWIDTSNQFNTSNLFTLKTNKNNFDFLARSKTNYFMKIVMVYPGNVWNNGLIYSFSTARNTLPYVGSSSYRFTIPAGYTKGTIELDSTLAFNSPFKLTMDTTISASGTDMVFLKAFNNIKKYHKMYMRYKIATATYDLNWYCTNQHFLIPSIYISGNDITPVTKITPLNVYDDEVAYMYEMDTGIQFNTKSLIRNYIKRGKSDSIRGLKFNRDYFARFKCFNSTKDTTDWSLVSTFSTLDSIPVSYNSAPVYYCSDLGIVFSVNKTPGVKVYQFQIDSNSNFINPKNYFTGIYWKLTDNPIVGKQYYWRLRMISEQDTSQWFSKNSFLYEVNYYFPYPFLIYPPDGATNISPVDLSFIWKDNTGKRSTDFQFVLKEQGAVDNIALCGKPTVLVKKLKPNTNYTWYVIPYAANYTPINFDLAQKFTFTTAGISSVSDLYPKNQLLLYPNPATERLSISLRGGDKLESLTLTSLDGKVILHQNNGLESEWSLDVRALQKGLYFITCTGKNGTTTSKFIKN